IHADFYYIDLKQSNAGSDAINTTNILPPPGQSLFKLSFAAVSLLLLFLIPTIMYVQQVEQKEIPATQTKKVLGVKAKSDTQKLPMRLIIPAISVNTNIQHVGITPEGEMDVPSNSIDVGWFEPGALPGEKGSAVIAGHFDSENGEAGVFNNLDKLKVGDKIYTKDNSGKSTTFAVKKKRLYDPGYAEEVFGRSDTAHLNLITCKGVWNDNLKSYSKRLVVFADRQ
ncbi:MAG TPA: class F sortase, partial [Candidatus Saccharimonadales bacterium]|nr:class F sortase [Candidatus Saccharimonadales bacterium]